MQMNTATVLAFDVGGANLKASDGGDFHASRYFPLWQRPGDLTDAIRAMIAEAPPTERIVATMTGELADCFATKREGVAAIVDALATAAGERPLLVYLTDGTFASPDEAKRRYMEAAASNWHATASLAARRIAPTAGVLIDVGSTTTDIISFVGGRAAAIGRTDTDRLASDELAYTGVVRSPICAVVQTLPWRGRVCSVAQELFATTRDAYLLLGLLPEDEADCHTADGRPATRAAARDRLARCICADRETFNDDDARLAAAVVQRAQSRRVAEAFARVTQQMPEPPQTVVTAGQGEFLAREALRHAGWVGLIVSQADAIGAAASCVGPAFALAHLAQ